MIWLNKLKLSLALVVAGGAGVAPVALADQPVFWEWTKDAKEAFEFGTVAKLPATICQNKMANGEMHPGVGWKGTCYVGFGGKSINAPIDEMIKVKGKVMWMKPLPEGAPFPGSVKLWEVGGNGMFICRAKDPAGDLRPGKAWKGNCYIAHGPKEIKTQTFEYMVMGANK